MRGLMRRNRRPTALRHLVSALTRDLPKRAQNAGIVPSHHILCAGTYSPVFARLAAESALAACPPGLREDFRLFIHVDGVEGRVRADLMSWLKEIPGTEFTYGLFGILSQDRIPGKWHQVMVNDVASEFRNEKHIAFIDADLFLVGGAWWSQLDENLADDLYSLSVGLRKNSTMTIGERTYSPIRTNLFTLNTRLHLELNRQRFSKDDRVVKALSKDFPTSNIELGNMDSMMGGSLQAQASGYRVVDISNHVKHCHVGGFSHLKAGKFKDFSDPERRKSIEGLLGQARFLPRVIDYFDQRGWNRFVDAKYRTDVEAMSRHINSVPELRSIQGALPRSARECVFDEVVSQLEGARL